MKQTNKQSYRQMSLKPWIHNLKIHVNEIFFKTYTMSLYILKDNCPNFNGMNELWSKIKHKKQKKGAAIYILSKAFIR